MKRINPLWRRQHRKQIEEERDARIAGLINSMTVEIDDQLEGIKNTQSIINDQCASLKKQISEVESQIMLEKAEAESKERKERLKKTRWNKADEYEFRFDPDQEITAVYINGKRMHGISTSNVSVDGDNQNPLITLEGYGSVKYTTGKVEGE